MFPNKIESVYIKLDPKQIRQGDILTDMIIHICNGGITIEIKLPYSVVMSQDCDLDQDFRNRSMISADDQDKFLQNVLICPAYTAEKFKQGKHLEAINLKMCDWTKNKSEYKKILGQNHARFHFLEPNPGLQVPELVVDFKHYQTIARETLYDIYGNHYLATINQLFRERLSQRFCDYLNRIGLPEFKKRDMTKSPLKYKVGDTVLCKKKTSFGERIWIGKIRDLYQSDSPLSNLYYAKPFDEFKEDLGIRGDECLENEVYNITDEKAVELRQIKNAIIKDKKLKEKTCKKLCEDYTKDITDRYTKNQEMLDNAIKNIQYINSSIFSQI